MKWSETTAPANIATERIFIGPDPLGMGGLQVAVARSSDLPSKRAVRDLFNARRGKTQLQLVVAVGNSSTTYLFGPDPQAQPVELPTEQAQRQLQSALDEPDVLAATERIAGFRKAHNSTAVAGYTNSGLFATYHLTQNLPQRLDWDDLNQAGSGLLTARGTALIDALGFKTQPATGGAVLLSTPTDASRAVAVLLDETEHFDSKSPRFQLTPVAYGLAVATQQEVPWLIVLRKDQIRLYPGRDGVGVGSKGQAETYFEIDLSTVDADYAGLLPLIFTANALAANGTADQLLEESTRYATELGKRLRERIYGEIIPPLAVEVTHQLTKRAQLRLDPDGLATAYRVTLRILFRLLFQAYAEDRGLLPSRRNEGFDANSLKTNAQRLIATEDREFGESATLWGDLTQVWDAIDKGNRQWQIPAYNGGLFSSDPDQSPDGALFTKIQIPDRVLGPALKHLLIDTTSDGVDGPVDFRSLSVREFGTIYEGLLESSLSMAEQDLTLDPDGAWVPVKKNDEVHVRSGGVYFHSASGERKATGSYFTPKVLVDHLIEQSVVPALTAHLDKVADHLNKGDVAAASRDFFDFRVADLAMGSGHFLVAAVDKIEALMRAFLAQHAVPGVTDELLRLAGAAKEALGTDDVAKSEVDEIGLLRRQVARRCIYGLDLNPMAVELARLALWIHTFVPGLPMSNLDHGLINADSLTGIGTVDEALDVLQPDRNPGQSDFFDDVITDTLVSAKTLLVDLASAGEANKAEIEESARLLEQAREASNPAERVFDVAVAARVGAIDAGMIFSEDDVIELARDHRVMETIKELKPAHMPVLFPEVFLRTNPGFDVLLGNPPWEELMVEEPKFWLRIRPGLLALKPAVMKSEIARLRDERPDMVAELDELSEVVGKVRQTMLKGPYPGLGTGDIDLYQAFAWRLLQLLRNEGRSGVVMPRSILNAAGPSLWREAMFAAGSLQAITLVNERRWIFPIDPRYSISLLTFRKCDPPLGYIEVCGPFYEEKTFLAGRGQLGRVEVSSLKVMTGSTVPQIATPQAAEVLNVIRKAPRLDARRPGWDFRPVREFDATNDRPTFDSEGRGTVPVLGGKGFELWNPGTGEVYAYGDQEAIEVALQAKRKRQVRLKSSAFHALSQAWADDVDTLPMRRPRIAFRDIARSTDTRTMIAALLPPVVALTNKAPYLYRRAGTALAEAYLLGVLSSIPLDWYARKYVELGMNLHILNGLPIPTFDPESSVAARAVEVAGRLAAVDDRYTEWAAEVGVPVGSVTTKSAKDDLTAELDAVVSLLYGLSEDQVEHIFGTFHRGWNYQSRLEAVLTHYARWKGQA
ncbi:MAG: Eco57I restriction-modification methylase domain-containing protein [Brachybacterium sp.]|uniref:Eco57I restriction-modification methylase domain-containing protein n=1 Tax=Brachybacterium sp. TaxID=1891286 RepID=UPI003F9029E1